MNNVLLIPLYFVTAGERIVRDDERRTIKISVLNKTKSVDMLSTMDSSVTDNNLSATYPIANSTVSDWRTRHYWALVLLIIPVTTLFGNLLVICSVIRYRNLHTAINYFILGLAFADLMVALAVMPFAVYVEVSAYSICLLHAQFLPVGSYLMLL